MYMCTLAGVHINVCVQIHKNNKNKCMALSRLNERTLLDLHIARIGMKPASVSATSIHFLKTKDRDPTPFSHGSGLS